MQASELLRRIPSNSAPVVVVRTGPVENEFASQVNVNQAAGPPVQQGGRFHERSPLPPGPVGR
jgi:hypothetical protein